MPTRRSRTTSAVAATLTIFLVSILQSAFPRTAEASNRAATESKSDPRGNWMLEMPDGASGWLTVVNADGGLKGELWTVGGGRALSEVAITDNTLKFVRKIKVGAPEFEGGPPTGERVACRYSATVDGDSIRLVMHRPL